MRDRIVLRWSGAREKKFIWTKYSFILGRVSIAKLWPKIMMRFYHLILIIKCFFLDSPVVSLILSYTRSCFLTFQLHHKLATLLRWTAAKSAISPNLVSTRKRNQHGAFNRDNIQQNVCFLLWITLFKSFAWIHFQIEAIQYLNIFLSEFQSFSQSWKLTTFNIKSKIFRHLHSLCQLKI